MEMITQVQEIQDYFYTATAFNPNQNTTIISSTLGNANKIGITTGATNYQVGDKVVFDNTGTDGRNAQAEVSRIGGQ